MASQEREAFTHTPLESPDRQIRLLEVRAVGDGAFEYSLETYILGSKHIPHFYALSYEWGAEHPTYPIIIQGKTFSIRENLKTFLDRIASGGEDFIRPLWIDAICIDQTQVAERNEQVKIMGSIFASAVLVLTWIGPQPLENGALAEIEVTLRDWETTEEFKQLSAGTLHRRPKLLSLQEPYGTMWTHLKLLCEAGYWHRLWIVQELIKANKLLLLWGVEQISWQALSIAFKTIYEANRGRRPSTQISGLWDIVEASVPYMVWLHLHGLETNHRLLQTMDIYRESKCSVSHDKAYALTGISTDAELLQVDYDKSLPDLYSDLMNLEPRTPHRLRYSHLVLEALHIDERSWDNGSVKGRSVSCDAHKVGQILAAGQLGSNASDELIQTETWELALGASLTNPDKVDVAVQWAQKIYAELKSAIGSSFCGASVFFLAGGQMGTSLSPSAQGDLIYRVQGLSRYSCKIDLRCPSSTASAQSSQSGSSGATRVWLSEEPTLLDAGDGREQTASDSIELSLGDLYAMDNLLEIDFIFDEVPASPTDEAPSSPRLPTARRAQSDTAERRRPHRSSTLSQSIDEAMGFVIRASSTWPTTTEGKATDGWYIDALAREMRDKLFTGTSPLNSPD